MNLKTNNRFQEIVLVHSKLVIKPQVGLVLGATEKCRLPIINELGHPSGGRLRAATINNASYKLRQALNAVGIQTMSGIRRPSEERN